MASVTDSGLRTINFTIQGTVPLMMHNGRLADPFYDATKRLKAATSKRKRTEDDNLEIQRIEWEGGLYLNSKGDVHIPKECLWATFYAGAKKSKQGPQYKAGVYINDNGNLIYDGPRNIEGLREKFHQFSDVRLCTVSQKRVLRTRPIFSDWKVKFSVEFDPSIIEESDVIAAVANAGRTVGLCEMRPMYGRYKVESVD